MRNLPSHTHNAMLCRFMALALHPTNERTTVPAGIHPSTAIGHLGGIHRKLRVQNRPISLSWHASAI